MTGLPVRAAPGQDTGSLFIRVEDRARLGNRDRVVVQNPVTRADREIYRSDGYIPDAVALSPDGREVSFVEILSGKRPREERVVVLDLSGAVVRIETAVDRTVWQYTWCGDGRLAILTGGTREETKPKPVSLDLVDVHTGAKDHFEGVERPWRIYWASFDSSLYIKSAPPAGASGPAAVPPVYRYHAPSRRLSLTTHRAFFFSPDGKYYFEPSVEGGPFRVYRRTDDRDVTATLILPAEQTMWGPEGGWMPGAHHVLVFIEKPPRREIQRGQRRAPGRLIDPTVPQVYPDRWNLAVDAETGQVIDRFQGDIGAGWRTNSPALPVERRAGVELVPPPQRP